MPKVMEFFSFFFLVFIGVCQGLHGGQICLSCDGVVRPRDCSTVVVCGRHEQCGVEQVVSRAGVVTYNVGCLSTSVCAEPGKRGASRVSARSMFGTDSGIVTCQQCCNGTDLCNSQGCGQSGFDPSTGKYCYSCPQHAQADKCDHIDFCFEDQNCFIGETTFVSDSFFESRCQSKQLCPATGSGRTACCSTQLCNSGNLLSSGSLGQTTLMPHINHTAPHCPSQWIIRNLSESVQFLYCLYPNKKVPWATAKLLCNRHNTHLPIIETDQEKAIIDGITSHTEIWLDATDKDREGVYIWSTTNETVSKYYWADNEPDDQKYPADEDCLEMGPNYLMGWNDAPCDRLVGVLCEYGLTKHVQQPSVACPTGWRSAFNLQYCVVRKSLNWYQSKNYCTTLGAHLPILDSKAKMDQIFQFEPNMEFWTDGTEEGHQGRWQWSAISEDIHNDLWLDGEPNNYLRMKEDCMETGDKYGWRWNDAPCSWQNRSTHIVCEKPSPNFGTVFG